VTEQSESRLSFFFTDLFYTEGDLVATCNCNSHPCPLVCEGALSDQR